MKASALILDKNKRVFLWKLLDRSRNKAVAEFLVPMSACNHGDLRTSTSRKLRGALRNEAYLSELKTMGLLTYYKSRAPEAKSKSTVCTAKVVLTAAGREFLAKTFDTELEKYDENLCPDDIITYQNEVIKRQQQTIRVLKQKLRKISEGGR